MMATLKERCKLATNCLPHAEYRTRLEVLHAGMLAEIDSLENKLFDKRVEVHDLKHALKTLLCDTDESDSMTGKERAQKARQLLVDLGE